MGFQLGPWSLTWMTLNHPSSRSLQLQSNISITMYEMQQHWADTRSIERISCSVNLLSGIITLSFETGVKDSDRVCGRV